MKIGIDISQIVYEKTGVSTYVKNLVSSLLTLDTQNSYILFGTSFRKQNLLRAYVATLEKNHKNVTSVILPIPPRILEILWNRMHICPISWFTGVLDIFWSSDWMQPPLGSVKGITTIHDLSILRYPESFNTTITSVHKRRLYWAKKECQHFLCDSKATKQDVELLLAIDSSKLSVIYPGLSLPS